MLLNKTEWFLMNNPLRALLQKYFEFPRLLRMGGNIHGCVLEVGCGRGVGAEVILQQVGVTKVHAFDLDPFMVSLAQKHLKKYSSRIKIWVGDVAKIPSESDTYDAVFDFGIIHHVPNWKIAIQEIFRVLKPGGRFYGEEVYRDFILNQIVRKILRHPLENRFNHAEFSLALKSQGFDIISAHSLRNYFGWFVAQKPI